MLFDLLLAKKLSGGGGGGADKETLLWTNPDTTANFNTKNVIEQSELQGYKYIKFVYRSDTRSTGAVYTLLFDAEYLQAEQTTTEVVVFYLSNRNYKRVVSIYTSGGISYLRFGNATQPNATTSANGNLIPLEIYGVN